MLRVARAVLCTRFLMWEPNCQLGRTQVWDEKLHSMSMGSAQTAAPFTGQIAWGAAGWDTTESGHVGAGGVVG